MHTSGETIKKHLWQAVFIGMLPLLLLQAGVAQAGSLTHQKSWKVIASPNAGIADQLNGIAAISKKDVWAVGDYLNSNKIQQTLIEHWNGSSWSIVASPNVGSVNNILYGVAAVSANDIWAVGVIEGSTWQTLIEHWDGSSWSVVANPASGILYGVTAVSARNVWAVGNYFPGIDHTLTEQWNGTSWKVVSTPDLGGFGSDLFGVAAVSARDIWAVGAHQLDQYTRDALLEHWDGTKWTPSSSTGDGDYNTLLGVASVASNDVWAVGYFSYISGPPQILIEHWNGTQWGIVDSGLQDNTLYAVAALSATDVWAVGSSDYPQTLIEHWDGTTWSVVKSPTPGVNSALYGVARVPRTKQLWAVGGYGASNAEQSLIAFYG